MPSTTEQIIETIREHIKPYLPPKFYMEIHQLVSPLSTYLKVCADFSSVHTTIYFRHDSPQLAIATIGITVVMDLSDPELLDKVVATFRTHLTYYPPYD